MTSVNRETLSAVQSVVTRPSSILVTGRVSDKLIGTLSSVGLLQLQTPKQSQFLSAQVPSSVELDLDRVEIAMNGSTGTHMLLFYDRPEILLADAMNTGEELDCVIAGWQKHAESILRLFRKYRQRTTMLDTDSICLNPDHFKNMISARLLLSQESNGALSPALNQSEDKLINLIFRHLVQEKADTRFVVAELEAGSATPLSSVQESITVRLKELFTMLKNPRDARLKNDLLHLHINQLQEELESNVISNKELDSRLEKMRQSKSWKLTSPLRAISRSIKGSKK